MKSLSLLPILLSLFLFSCKQGEFDLSVLSDMFDEINYCTVEDDCASYSLYIADPSNGTDCLCSQYYYNENESLDEILLYIESNSVDSDCCRYYSPSLCGTELRCTEDKCMRYACPSDEGGECLPDCP